MIKKWNLLQLKMHIPKEISSFFNLKNTGLIVGYAQFFLSAIFINSVPAPMIISVIMGNLHRILL